MKTKDSKYNLCEFDSVYPCANLKRFDQLAKAELCDHLRKVSSKTAGYELYTLMDSNCHQFRPEVDRCDKGESALLRLILQWTGKSQNTKPRAVTCVLTSLRQDLLRFPDGNVEGVLSVLDLKDKPLWIRSIYTKAGKIHCRPPLNVKVDKTPTIEVDRAPVEIEVLLWKNYPKTNNGSQKAHLEIAVPLTSPVISATCSTSLDDEITDVQLSDSDLVDIMANLVSGQFEILITRLGVPRASLALEGVAPAKKATQILQWVASQNAEVRDRLLKELKTMAPWRFKSKTPE